MKTYSIMFYKETGDCFRGIIYPESQTPPKEAVPPECELVFFDEASPDYNMLYAIFVEDPDKIAIEYTLPPVYTVKYNFTSKRFLFTKPQPIDVLGLIREERNRRLLETDRILLIPDLPDNLKQLTIDYRQQLRDITDLYEDGMEVLDIPWPVIPEHH